MIWGPASLLFDDYLGLFPLGLRWPRYESCRSQWPRGLKRRSAAARLLGLLVRIPPGHGCLSVVSVVRCQVEVSATG